MRNSFSVIEADKSEFGGTRIRDCSEAFFVPMWRFRKKRVYLHIETTNETTNAMTTKKEQQQQDQEMKKLQLELIELMLSRAGITREDIYDTALRSWVAKNLDLLTAAERKKYEKSGVLASEVMEPDLETISISFDENDLRARLAVDLLVSLGARIVNIEHE